MRKCLLLVLCLLSGWVMAEPLVMLASEHTVPKHFASDGKCQGYGVELGVAVLREAGFTAEARCLPWARAIKEGEQERGVMAPVFSKTPEREALFLFSNKVMDDPVVLVQASKHRFAFSSPEDLAGKRVGTTRASRFSAEFNAVMPRMLINEDGGPDLRLQMLVAGRLDAAVIAGGVSAVRYNAMKAGISMADLYVVQLPIMLDSNYFAIARHHPNAQSYITRINGAIRRMQGNRSLNRLLEEARSHY